MIRKPGEEDFRENDAIVAMRETRKIAIEGSRGVGKGLLRIYLMILTVIMGFGLITSLMSAMGGVGFLLVLGGGAWLHNRHKGTAMARESAIAQSAYNAIPGHVPHGAAGYQTLPPGVRRDGAVYLDIGLIMQQAVTLFAVGVVLLLMTGKVDSTLGMFSLLGMAFVALAVLVAARVVGDRKVLEWDSHAVTVHHLLGQTRAQWSDVRDIAVLQSSRLNFSTYLLSGASRNLELIVPFNRLGGATRLAMPLRLTTLSDNDLEALLRDLMVLQAAAQSYGAAYQQRPQPLYTAPEPPLHFIHERSRFAYRDEEDEVLTARARDGFDPDAIMARYLRERETLQAQDEARREAALEAEAQRRASMRGPPRAGGFGRKGL